MELQGYDAWKTHVPDDADGGGKKPEVFMTRAYRAACRLGEGDAFLLRYPEFARRLTAYPEAPEDES